MVAAPGAQAHCAGRSSHTRCRAGARHAHAVGHRARRRRGAARGRNGDHQRELATMGTLQDGDLVVALGGDGTVLAALRAAALGNAPVLGIACGSLGALSAVTADQIDDALERVWAGGWTARSLPALAIGARARPTTGPPTTSSSSVAAPARWSRTSASTTSCTSASPETGWSWPRRSARARTRWPPEARCWRPARRLPLHAGGDARWQRAAPRGARRRRPDRRGSARQRRASTSRSTAEARRRRASVHAHPAPRQVHAGELRPRPGHGLAGLRKRQPDHRQSAGARARRAREAQVP